MSEWRMIEITDKSQCSGCKACANACPAEAISFSYDDEGFWYPEVNLIRCIHCGKCEIVCPFLKESKGIPYYNKSFDVVFFAAQLKNVSRLASTSSGGVFQALASIIINNGGIVYGAVQENVDKIFHIRVSNMKELERTSKSKYFQSDIQLCYKQAKSDLIEGKEVLFSGTGCQIAGLNCYLEKTYQNLYTCEVVCHGVPSDKIWKLYRKEKENCEGKKIIDLVFRDKSQGWSNNQYKITYEDGSVEYEKSTVQLFHSGYLQGLFYRPSCGSCPFARIPRVADITLADYWQYKGYMNVKDVGVSLVAVNNQKGMKLFKLSDSLLNIETTTRISAIHSCHHMDEHPSDNQNRKAFIEMAIREGYYAAAKEFIRTDKNTVLKKVKKKVKAIIRRA